ncbi:FdhF/YdeP family oxidoreductase [Neorhodopirellula pilleata]|uniref:Putative formate dehydrogenase n=1 Tax=Neorhodopirellula pilleata TaxID=2714738 RepID=A0A5C6A8A7_9BACT|nr:FdhF/YdeP family oxidoreductase [Neorhodopirellula pilleata]TWT95545.1 putative formate dehydrogenase [Neorhodopirellula pilleata]
MSTTLPSQQAEAFSDVIDTDESFPLDNGHAPVHLIPTEKDGQLKQTPVKTKGTGLSAVVSSFKYAIGEAGLMRGTLPMLQVNQKDGFDCPGCAWPDPDGHRSAFEFCENGAKAIAHESDRRRVTRDFFERYSVSEMSRHSDYWLEQQGRLTEPMVLREGATHYTPISWDDAYALIADELGKLDSPDEACFYTSGKATNEAAFVFQTMVRAFGTNNLPDCSNMCHESSGRAMTRMFGNGKGTVLLEDFKEAELVFVVGQNPGTNHPRQLSALQQSKRAGAKIITVNPLPEAGLMGFMNPQEVGGMLGIATQLTDVFLQVKINGDIALFKGIMKQLVEWDDAEGGGIIDREFVQQHTVELEPLLESLRAASWDEIARRSGISRDQISETATLVREREKIVICWCLGVTQHLNGTQNVQEFLNLLLLRGAIGKPGAGACCVRGHSNVQGDRTMGVWEQPKREFLDRMQAAFGFDPPRHHGYDSQRAAIAMHEGKLKVFVSLGGNFLMAMPDTRYGGEGLQQTELTVRIGTKLNRADLVTGKQSLILPCLGRTESDVRIDADGTKREQISSTENSMGVVQRSTGRFAPASKDLLNETEILCRIAHAIVGDRVGIDWLAWANDYDRIRDAIAKVIPGFEDYNRKVRQDGGFYLPNGPRQRQFPTPQGKAVFTVNPIPREEVGPGEFAMTTVRSHDQFNTTIYGPHDRYRGIYNARQVVMMNEADMVELGLKPQQPVHVTSCFEGNIRRVCGFKVVPYPIPRQCLAMYYPEANPLIPMERTDEFSNCPSFKLTVVTVEAADKRSDGHR